MRRRGAVTTTNEMNELNPIICRGRRLDDPNEINENGFETAGVVSLRLGHVRVLTYHRYVIHYPHAASLPPPYNTTPNKTKCLTSLNTAQPYEIFAEANMK